MDSHWSSGSHCGLAHADLSQKLVVWLHSDWSLWVKHRRKPAPRLPALSQHLHTYVSEWDSSMGSTKSFAPRKAMPSPKCSPSRRTGSFHVILSILRPFWLLLGLHPEHLYVTYLLISPFSHLPAPLQSPVCSLYLLVCFCVTSVIMPTCHHFVGTSPFLLTWKLNSLTSFHNFCSVISTDDVSKTHDHSFLLLNNSHGLE